MLTEVAFPHMTTLDPTEDFGSFNLKIRMERPVYTSRKSQSPWPRPPERLGTRRCLRWRLRL